MNSRLAVCVLLFAVSIVSCGKVDEDEILGTWVGQAAGGRQKPGSFRETWTFKDGTIILPVDAHTSDFIGRTYKVDVTKSPKQIDITTSLRDKDERIEKGIYKIENDTLTLCYLVPQKAKPGAKRPDEFYPSGRDDVMVLTFRRKT